MNSARRQTYVTPEEYLAGELTAEVRHEYIDGEVYAMVGASKAHITIVGNLFVLFRSVLKRPCRVYNNDGKVRIEAANAFYYPELFVTCEKGEIDPYVTCEPLIVVEVLSPTTAAIDQRQKLRDYKTVPSVREVALVWQDQRRVELHRRDGDGWIIEEATDSGTADFLSIRASFDLDAIYADLP